MEGILNAEWYEPLFKEAQNLFGNAIYAYYFEIPFEVTVRRHNQRHISSFGEKQMRSWWKEKDYIGFIPETKFSNELSLAGEIDIIMKDIKG